MADAITRAAPGCIEVALAARKATAADRYRSSAKAAQSAVEAVLTGDDWAQRSA